MGNNITQNESLRQQLISIVGSIPFGILTLSDKLELNIINNEAVKLLGFSKSKPHDLIDMSYSYVLANIPKLVVKFERSISKGERRQFDLYNIKTSMRHLNIKCRPMQQGFLIILEDITAEKILHYQATHDSLTQLINRQQFEDRLQNVLVKSKENNLPSVIVFIDLDRFKPINDTAGHAAGDELLKRVSFIMQSRIRNRDTVARIGGDEFSLLLQDCPLHVAKRITENIRKDIETMAFSYAGKVFNITISAGLVPINSTYNNISTLMNAADTACLQAKNEGRNKLHIINQEQGDFEAHMKQIAWLDAINNALAHDQFILYAQKIIPLNTDSKLTHYELCIRLKQSDGSIIPPNAFIPSAERYELMPQIDKWVIQQAFKTIKVGEAYSINLSGQTLSDINLANYITVLQAKYGIDPKQITFEITETAAIQYLDKTTAFILQLKKYGYSFSLDDFGTGLSSFSYLKQMAVDYLKIDGQFVKDISTDTISYAMVKSINDIGHAMGLKTIAEYVENTETMEKLQEIGVDSAQGYYLHQPQPLKEITQITDTTSLKLVKK
ncbi:MAG: EAL domain-containing protein [Gammaproteobacteria bacterium]